MWRRKMQRQTQLQKGPTQRRRQLAPLCLASPFVTSTHATTNSLHVSSLALNTLCVIFSHVFAWAPAAFSSDYLHAPHLLIHFEPLLASLVNSGVYSLRVYALELQLHGDLKAALVLPKRHVDEVWKKC